MGPIPRGPETYGSLGIWWFRNIWFWEPTTSQDYHVMVRICWIFVTHHIHWDDASIYANSYFLDRVLVLLDIVFVIYYTLLLDAFLSNLFPYLLLSCIVGKRTSVHPLSSQRSRPGINCDWSTRAETKFVAPVKQIYRSVPRPDRREIFTPRRSDAPSTP